MGRRKQSQPHRSGGIILENHGNPKAHVDRIEVLQTVDSSKNERDEVNEPYFVEVDRAGWNSNEHRDISEIVLTNINFGHGFLGFQLDESFYENLKYSLRFRLCNINGFILSRMKLGHWPVLSLNDISLELIERGTEEDRNACSVVLSGHLDGVDEAISGLVHLVNLKFMTLRPVLGAPFSHNMVSLRLRVEMLSSAFDACESILDSGRQMWKKSMMNAMAWLRPEVVTSEAKYGVAQSTSTELETHLHHEMRDDDASNSRKHVKFDAVGFYEAIKPSKDDPVLNYDLPDLLPKLRPYQRRAAYWMVSREKGYSGNLGVEKNVQPISPLCMALEFLDTSSRMFYNPFSGNLALNTEYPSSHVCGGILADEMGLGKTIEVLACILAHRMSVTEGTKHFDNELKLVGDQQIQLKRLKRERVECVCGAVSENLKYRGLWVQCDICDAWQHADCVGYSPKGRALQSRIDTKEGESRKEKRRKKYTVDVIVRDGEHICTPCSELVQATDSPMATGATLIVCPAPILSQWHAEIMCHTRPGSVKTCVYEGVKDTSISSTLSAEINNLINSDIVLTSYDVLKEDLSHDSDRHEGDRRFMRFQKRYPVTPTPLTRILWWRVCLDEGQMVESNATAATEMASRLYACHRWCITGTPIQRKLEDLYGLIRFIKASPFNVHRWWVEVIRDPYERIDLCAMEFTHKFFKQIMWRSSKIHITDELELPPQEERVTWLTFSPIEEHFYQRQHETCLSYAQDVIQSLKDDIVKRKDCVSSDASSDILITHADAGKLLSTLLKLRQACCHPQVGSSGLRSLQQSPMTMEEILMVLVSKTKIEGEEALRRSVVALNALAGIAIIEKNFSEACSLYKEALGLAEENSEDFRLDPLLNIHIHHNLAEILPLSVDQTHPSLKDQLFTGICEVKASEISGSENHENQIMKKQKISGTFNSSLSSDRKMMIDGPLKITEKDTNIDEELNSELHKSSISFDDDSLRKACEITRQKYLAVFSSKLSIAQQEFTKSNTQVCSELGERKNLDKVWWFEAVDHAEQNNDISHELIRKIEEAVSGNLNNSKSSRAGSRFRSINALKYHIQTGLDLLEASRKVVLDRLLEIDQSMENPRDEDIERVRYCRNCQPDSNGPPCVLCELDELFQEYEARLFRLNKVQGGMITSVEEAVEAQKKKSALNRFYWSLLQQNNNLPKVGYEESNKRDVGEKVMVSKHPSELEVVLGVVKNFCKTQLGKESKAAANKQLHLLENMRKEYGHARSLAIAQAQVLNAHDEIKMATTRLCLRDNDDDSSAYAISENELPAANVQYSSDKFLSLAMLSRIKGKLRYLKGLVQSKQNTVLCSINDLASKEMAISSTSTEQKSENGVKAVEESCPVCQEKLSNQKMVFQCGHVTCCKCLFAMTERTLLHDSKVQTNWVMCPTCRQHTDFGNIAYADDSKNEPFNPSKLHETSMEHEGSMTVQGSYGTKIEAVVRRILWIKFTDSKAKVLVFSSWNDVLDVLQHAFAANGITFIRMKGGRKSHIAISEFRGQKVSEKENSKKGAKVLERGSAQVLLLLIQHGANGLNLLEAQHVVLVEPLLNPAAEAQAISRVHRIGQENETFVHRFMVKGTVEESIYKLNRSRGTSSLITGNVKNLDQPFLTLKEVESLFASKPQPLGENDDKRSENLRHLAPSMAAAIAAERRFREQQTT